MHHLLDATASKQVMYACCPMNLVGHMYLHMNLFSISRILKKCLAKLSYNLCSVQARNTDCNIASAAIFLKNKNKIKMVKD